MWTYWLYLSIVKYTVTGQIYCQVEFVIIERRMKICYLIKHLIKNKEHGIIERALKLGIKTLDFKPLF